MKKGEPIPERIKVHFKGVAKLLHPGHDVYRLNLLSGVVDRAPLIPVEQKGRMKWFGMPVGKKYSKIVAYMVDEQKYFHYLPASSLYNAIKLFKHTNNDLIKSGELTIITKS